jgi:chromosomal replication initiation ATPase DnaA
MDENNLWNQVLSRLSVTISRCTFHVWFNETRFISSDDTTLTVGVPNDLYGTWLAKRYSTFVDEALTELGRGGTMVNYVADPSLGIVTASRDRGARPLAPEPLGSHLSIEARLAAVEHRLERLEREDPSGTRQGSSRALT